MVTFATSAEAKEYLVKAIVAEAQRQGSPLSETERQMLYFSESEEPLPDTARLKAWAAFEQECDSAAFEQKIGGLIRSYLANTKASDYDSFKLWAEAARAIRSEDHYLLVMLNAPGASVRPRYDLLKLIAAGLLIVIVVVAIAIFQRQL